jgi:hypothetical protein
MWREYRILLRIAVLVGIVTLAGCDGMEVATKSDEVNALKNIRSGNFELINKEELADLRKTADIAKSVGRYQINRDGIRTWRFDTSTGQICLLLSTDADLKSLGISTQKCATAADIDPKDPAGLFNPNSVEELEFGPNGKLRKKISAAGGNSLPNVPEVGTLYRFKGGDPADPNNWEKLPKNKVINFSDLPK